MNKTRICLGGMIRDEFSEVPERVPLMRDIETRPSTWSTTLTRARTYTLYTTKPWTCEALRARSYAVRMVINVGHNRYLSTTVTDTGTAHVEYGVGSVTDWANHTRISLRQCQSGRTFL